MTAISSDKTLYLPLRIVPPALLAEGGEEGAGGGEGGRGGS